MRLFLGLRLKNHAYNGSNDSLRSMIYAANGVLDKIQPWDPVNTRLNLRWFNGDGRVCVLFRSNEPETSQSREGWISNKNRAWAWSGIIAEGLWESLNNNSISTMELGSKLPNAVGSFALLGATAESFGVATNAHRAEAVYYGETSEILLVSNSAALINMLLNDGKPQYSHLGVAGAIVHGLPVTESTIFEGVKIVPANSLLVSDEKNDLKIESLVDENQTIEDIEELSDNIAESLVEYAKLLSGDSAAIRAAATGGKDSRLVLAALKAAGLQFETYTNGLEESGEVRIGREVSKALGVPHRVLKPAVVRSATGHEVVPGFPETQAWQTLRSTGGLGNAFTQLANPLGEHQDISKIVNFGGQGGEIVRGGYLREMPYSAVNRDSVRGFFNKTWFNNQDLLTPLAQEACRADLGKIMELASSAPAKALFEGYCQNRTGRWLATMRHGESVVNSHTTLLINNEMVSSMMRTNVGNLADEKLAFKVMEKLNLTLVQIPFFRDRWAFEKQGPSSFFDPDGWSAREPYTAHKQPRASFNWRVAYSKSLSDFFRDYLMSFPNSILFDVIEKEAVLSMLSGKGYRAPAAWALFSTQYALQGGWLESAPPQKPARIEVPVPR